MKMIEKHLAMLAAGIGLFVAQGAVAAQPEADSAYRWGRWAVLSPAAGGAEPFVAAVTPGADYNARPNDADAFDPKFTVNEAPGYQPPIVVPNPPGSPPPVGGPRGGLTTPEPGVVQNPPGAAPPVGGPRSGLL